MTHDRCATPPASERRSRLPLLALLCAGALAISVPLAQATHEESGLSDQGCAITQGGWGSEPSGHNPGALLEHWFDELFPDGLTVGDLHFDSAEEVRDFMDNTGGGFGANFERQAVALALNIAFGDAGLLDGTLTGVMVVGGEYDGWTAGEVLEEAEGVMVDDPTITGREYSALNDAMDDLNREEFGCAEPCPDVELTAIAQADGSIELSWNDVEVDSYNIYRAADDGELSFLASTSDTNYTDEATAVGVSYTYAITVVVDERESAICDRAEATAIPFFGSAVLGGLALIGSVAAMRWMRRR